MFRLRELVCGVDTAHAASRSVACARRQQCARASGETPTPNTGRRRAQIRVQFARPKSQKRRADAFT